MAADNIDANLYGVDLFGEPVRIGPKTPLADKFVFPPFTTLDTRTGEWQTRRRAWLSMGIRSEVGRDAKAFNIGGWMEEKAGESWSDVSIFDPVLCELTYRWFCRPGGVVLDPFAGGSVRGIVAGAMGLCYHGIELRPEQVAANEKQSEMIGPELAPSWQCGDSACAPMPDADLVFSCPPYGDLETYSKIPGDISNMEWHAFSAAYRHIIHRAATALLQDRFACFVVGNYRDGHRLRDLVGLTTAAFEAEGMVLYNEAVLLNSTGTAAIRAEGTFGTNRKLVRCHQTVLVYLKGDAKAAAAWAKGLTG